MSKKSILIFAVAIFLFYLLFTFFNNPLDKLNDSSGNLTLGLNDSKKNVNDFKKNKEKSISKNKETSLENIKSSSIFVPYWAGEWISEKDYDRYIYFGITVDKNGVIKDDSGYLGLDNFLSIKPDAGKKLLTVRMLDRDMNREILSDKASWDSIFSDVINLVEEKGFDGVVLDLELGLMAFGSYTENVTPFTKKFFNSLNENDIYFAFSIYGDCFFRKRPYNIEEISTNVDEIMIMAYDFTKSFGNPGPNFPFSDSREQYGYSFQQMIDDYLTFVPADKISVIFGMYGYHWIVDDQGRALKQAKAVTLNEVQNKYINDCPYKDCIIKWDEISGEGMISFIDEEGYKNIIYYEDKASLREKKEFIKSKGIGDIVFWAAGYF
jgi:spore germination protein YaaH